MCMRVHNIYILAFFDGIVKHLVFAGLIWYNYLKYTISGRCGNLCLIPRGG